MKIKQPLNILLVEDDRAIANVIKLELEHSGHTVTTAFDGNTGLHLCLDQDWDILLLDIMLPYVDGYQICKDVKRIKNMPILMLTAKGDVDDRVLGLDLGADDYLIKPFVMEELLARINAMVRRQQGFPEIPYIVFHELTLDLVQKQCFFRDENIDLTKTEFNLLALLAQHPNCAYSRDKIIEEVWGHDFCGDSNLVDSFVRLLRQKIDKRFGVNYIHTVRGVGYLLRYEVTR